MRCNLGAEVGIWSLRVKGSVQGPSRSSRDRLSLFCDMFQQAQQRGLYFSNRRTSPQN